MQQDDYSYTKYKSCPSLGPAPDLDRMRRRNLEGAQKAQTSLNLHPHPRFQEVMLSILKIRLPPRKNKGPRAFHIPKPFVPYSEGLGLTVHQTRSYQLKSKPSNVQTHKMPLQVDDWLITSIHYCGIMMLISSSISNRELPSRRSCDY